MARLQPDPDHDLARNDEVDRDHPVLIAAFYDVTCLNIDVLIGAISDRQFVDVAGFIDDYFLLGQGFLKSQERSIAGEIISMNQKYGQVVVGVRA